MAGAEGRAGPALGAGPASVPGPRRSQWRGREGSGAGARRAASKAAASAGRNPGTGAAGSKGWRGGSNVLYFSSSSDDEFEMLLTKLETPRSRSKKTETSLKDFNPEWDDLFWDLKKSSTKSAQKDLQTPKKLITPGKRNTCCQELQYPDTSRDTDSSVFVQSAWHNHREKGVKNLKESQKCINLSPPQNRKESVFNSSPDLLVRRKGRSCANTEKKLPTVALGQSTGVESDSSDDSFGSLMERIKKRNLPRKPVLSTKETVFQPSTTENIKPPCKDSQPVEGKGVKTPKPKSISLQETPSMMTPARIPGNESVGCSQLAKTEKRPRVCSMPGCFLQDLSNPASHYVKYFKKNKEELAQNLYRLFNSTIFDQKIKKVVRQITVYDEHKATSCVANLRFNFRELLSRPGIIVWDIEHPPLLPEDMAIIWNKKMTKTAGYCVTGQKEGPERKRYARIELSEKVCDSADRLRDTLIHEICHAATWLINGIRDGHGQLWSFYASKSAVIHPELPVVTRCHSYEINYKFIYECVRCKATVGRHSRSLDTERFVCASCRGQLVLRQPPGKGGTPARTQLTPFAKYVKENYGLVKREQCGLSHAGVMKKLSADFALKTKLEDSF